MGALSSGKTTAAQVLVDDYGFVRLRMADILKDMLRTLGLTDEEVDGSLKEEPSGLLCDQTPRHAMQTLGTEWGRQLIGDRVWVNATVKKIATIQVMNPGANIVIDDIRFMNEVQMVQNFEHIDGFDPQLWLIRRPEVEPVDHASLPFLKRQLLRWNGEYKEEHPSERLWRDGSQFARHTIHNLESETTFMSKVQKIAEAYVGLTKVQPVEDQPKEPDMKLEDAKPPLTAAYPPKPTPDTRYPRGIRNCNPGNIEAGADWKGLSKTHSGQDDRFAVFSNPKWGIRAIMRTLTTYRNKHGLNDVYGIIKRWAPAFENNTVAYATRVAKALGVGVNEPLGLDGKIVKELAKVIVHHENGQQPYPDELFDKAYTAEGKSWEKGVPAE
jgi:hypothetical protein